LIDFGERAAGDPVWDFVDYGPGVPELLEGYEPDAAMRARFDDTFALYRLLRAIPGPHAGAHAGRCTCSTGLPSRFNRQKSASGEPWLYRGNAASVEWERADLVVEHTTVTAVP
jgi:hypothetical protein